jgi:hydroxymethylbilane synthase
MKALRLATRTSALALVQSGSVAQSLRSLHPGLSVDIIPVRSEGDRRSDEPLSKAGGSGLFTGALEEALLRGEADFAVHSLKDLPTRMAPGLALAAVGPREDWRDAWLSPAYASPWDMPPGARVGTGSPRRRAQLQWRRPELRFEELRGNVDTRLDKLADGVVDGAVLAMAGLKRLGLESRVRHVFSEREMLPAPGQGFLAVQTRLGEEAFRLCRALNDPEAEAEAACERAFLACLEAGCLAPVGALARREGAELTLEVFAALDPGRPLRVRRSGNGNAPAALGAGLAEELLKGVE